MSASVRAFKDLDLGGGDNKYQGGGLDDLVWRVESRLVYGAWDLRAPLL